VRYVRAVAKAGFAATLAAVALCACAGTERPIFESVVASVDPPEVRPPMGRADAGAPDMEMRTLPPPPMALPPDDDEDAGSRPDPGLDPTAEFPWTQTLPGAGTCRSGRYAGAFDCIITGELTGWPLTVTGEVAFTLTGSAELQVLTVEEGSLQGPFLSASTITGQLDCMSDKFDALSTDGVVGNPLFPDAFASFLMGTFDDQALSIEGAFTTVNDDGQQCKGIFNVSIAP
jgi:hypothetical protein